MSQTSTPALLSGPARTLAVSVKMRSTTRSITSSLPVALPLCGAVLREGQAAIDNTFRSPRLSKKPQLGHETLPSQITLTSSVPGRPFSSCSIEVETINNHRDLRTEKDWSALVETRANVVVAFQRSKIRQLVVAQEKLRRANVQGKTINHLGLPPGHRASRAASFSRFTPDPANMITLDNDSRNSSITVAW